LAYTIQKAGKIRELAFGKNFHAMSSCGGRARVRAWGQKLTIIHYNYRARNNGALL
jgi:hypothetical protein